MQNKLTRIFLLALVLGFVGGCADPKRLDAIEATANKALANANSAAGAANNALGVASEAAYAATQAQADATAALECCNDNAVRMDRMFEKAMMK